MSAERKRTQHSAPLELDDLEPAMAAPPDDVAHAESSLAVGSGHELFWQSWESPDADRAPRAVIALMHGYGEHSARYHHVAAALVRAGYAVMALDARGHGRSPGRRGHVELFDDYARDLDLLISEIRVRWPSQPVFVLGHSHGGLIALRHALDFPGRAVGYVLTSPFCGFKISVPPIKALAGRLMSRLWPSFTMASEIDPEVVCQHPKVVAQYGTDPLNHDVATARWFTEAKAAQADTLTHAGQIDQPFLWLVAGADELADPRAAEAIYHNLGSASREFELFPELYHEILNEQVWPDIVRRIVAWLDTHHPGASS